MNPHLQLVQDGALGHAAGETQQELQERGISMIFWPAYSPDLNPIEAVWNWMNDYAIQLHFGERLSYDQPIKEAWDSITKDQLNDLIASMPERCQAVIDSNGMHAYEMIERVLYTLCLETQSSVRFKSPYSETKVTYA
jgi:hypothetical protein